MVFDIVFEFFPNPHFTNTELRKRYVIDLLPDQCDYVVASHCDVIQPDSAEEGDADAEGTRIEMTSSQLNSVRFRQR